MQFHLGHPQSRPVVQDRCKYGDFDVSWDNPSSESYTLQELASGGSWTYVDYTNGTSHSFTGHTMGDFSYRLKRVDVQCSGWPEPICYGVTTYSETISVAVNDPPPPGGGDPFPPPGPFTPPDDTAFPDDTIVNPSPPLGDDNVGTLQANAGVSGGQASYSIPIVVPPGRKGMQPSVSLNYSSSSGNGLVGVGWNLGATSAVSRCSATAITDQFTAAPQYHATRDRLCLDGRRLVPEDGYTYGASGAKYRTELESWVQVTQNGALNSGSTSFTAKYKNGRVSTFGGTTDSRHTAPPRTAVLTWAISDTQDPSGNTITYDYLTHGIGEHLIDAIHYTGYNGSDGDRHVEFAYEPKSESRSYFMAGGKTQSTKRLKEIRTKYQSSTIRTYTLIYEASDSSARDLLKSVQECAYDPSSHCLPVTTFEWQERAVEYVSERLQFFDPSNLISGIPDSLTGGEIVHEDKRALHQVLPRGDTNGDGVKDWDGFQVNAEGQVTETEAISLHTCFKKANSWGMTCLTGDFNADGRTDHFRQYNNKLQIAYTDPDLSALVWFDSGLSWDGGAFPSQNDEPLGFADFNGDGWLDIAFRQKLTLQVFFHTKNLGAPYSDTPAYRHQVSSYGPNGSGGLTNDIQIYGDMDGNGTPDFVYSNIPGDNTTPGLPIPQTIYQTHSQAGGGMTITTRSIPNYTSSLVNGNFLHDVNSDGLPDIVSLYGAGASGTLQYILNDGTGFPGDWIDLGVSIPTRPGTYLTTTGQEEIYGYPIMSKILVMDYNGDGRDELLYADTVLASSCAEVQQPMPPGPEWKCDDELYFDYQNPYTEVGGPINADVLDNSVRIYKVIYFSENASGTISGSTPVDSQIIASASQTAAIDATGDGLIDVVTVFGCRTTPCQFNTDITLDPQQHPHVKNSLYAKGAWINRNPGATADIPLNGKFDYAATDLMSATEDAFGNRHEWTYKPLSSDQYDTATSQYYFTDHDYQETDPDYFHFASSMYVVAEHSASNGIGGLNDTLYRYRGAIYNNKGRGFQGFRAIEVEEAVNASTDKVSRTEFHQKWPISSIVETSCVWLATDTIIVPPTDDDPNPKCSNVEDSVKLLSKIKTDVIHNVATTGGARFVAVKKQTITSYDLADRTLLLTTKITDRNFDTWGNVIYESQWHDDDWGEVHAETTTDFFPANESIWWLDKIDERRVQYNPVADRHGSSPSITPGTDNIKIITTDFIAYAENHRLPSQVKITGNDTPLWSQVDAAYNAYGLPTHIETDGTDVTGPRTVDTTYSKDGTIQADDGYFPYAIANSLGHTSTQHTDPKHGQPTSQWSPNNLQSVTSYDAFGRITETTPAGQPTAYQRFFWCSGGTICPAGASYTITTLSAGTPEINSYLDQFGREVQSSIKNFADTSFINVTTDYDERGNTIFQSQPYDIAAGESATIGTRFLSFDALGRLQTKEIDQADGTIFLTAYTFDGLKTSINASGLLMHRIYNGLEQLVETEDALDGITRYAYDGAGNPIVLQDPNAVIDSNIASITASYNALGHKQWVDDPNMGLKNFTYNALGEVLSELDANGDDVGMLYDELGRLTDRFVNGALDGKWHYDNTDTNKGLGLLDFEDSQFRGDGSRLQKFYYYSDAGTGRKAPLQVTHRFYENTDPNDFLDYDTAYFTDGYYGRPKGMRYPDGAGGDNGTGLAYSYNNAGYVTEEKDSDSSYVYRQITARDSRNQITQSTLTNGLLTQTAQYYANTGQMKLITVSNGGGNVHDLYYEYDTFGNLDYQRTTYAGALSTENFVYDDLHRLTQSRRSINGVATPDINYSFDASGNLTSKSDYASLYNYPTSRPNAVDSVTLVGGGSVNFYYDGNGNMTDGHNKTLTYNAFNKPATITKGSNSTECSYGADLMRYRQEMNSGERTYYLDKLMEIITVGTSTDYRHYLSDVVVLTKTGALNDPNPGIDYLHRDRLGSLATITDKNGLSAQARGFDPFGKPRDGDWADRNPPTLDSTITDRGFTEHEHLDDYELIHMNGRAFDYNLGRFLSVDPFIQDPGNSQSLNPYSYIMNNPLAGTDPSGYLPESASVDTVVASLEPGGRSQAVQNEAGENIGRVALDKKGNLHVTNNGGAAGQGAIFTSKSIMNGSHPQADELRPQLAFKGLTGAPDGSGSGPNTMASNSLTPSEGDNRTNQPTPDGPDSKHKSELEDGNQAKRGNEYAIPSHIAKALEGVFSEQDSDDPDIQSIRITYSPSFVKAHFLFKRSKTGSVTRPDRIYTNLSEDDFFALDLHVLHEFYHVIQQWGRENMTVPGYVLRNRRREREARDFAKHNLDEYRRLLKNSPSQSE